MLHTLPNISSVSQGPHREQMPYNREVGEFWVFQRKCFIIVTNLINNELLSEFTKDNFLSGTFLNIPQYMENQSEYF